MDKLFLFFAVHQNISPTLNCNYFDNFLSCSKPCSIPPFLRPFPPSGPPCTPKFSTWPVDLSAETFTVSPSDPQEKSNLSFHTSPLDSPTLFKQKMNNNEIENSCCHQEEVTGHQCVAPGKTMLLSSEEVAVLVSVPVPPVAPGLFPGPKVMASCSAPLGAAHMNNRQGFTGRPHSAFLGSHCHHKRHLNYFLLHYHMESWINAPLLHAKSHISNNAHPLTYR